MSFKQFGLCAAVSMALGLSLSAQANDYSFSYIATDSSLTASGTITTANILDGSGYDITGISGTVGGNAISGLLGGTVASGYTTSPNGSFYYDNKVYSGPSLSLYGVLFSATNSAAEWNLWGNGGSSASLYSGLGTGNYPLQTNGTLSLSLLPATGGGLVASVPEPESYAMLLSGLVLVGAIVRRKQRAQSAKSF